LSVKLDGLKLLELNPLQFRLFLFQYESELELTLLSAQKTCKHARNISTPSQYCPISLEPPRASSFITIQRLLSQQFLSPSSTIILHYHYSHHFIIHTKALTMTTKPHTSILPFHCPTNPNDIEMNTITEPGRIDSTGDSGATASTRLIRNDARNTRDTRPRTTIDTWIALASLGVAVMQFVQGFFF
jgi:hypothetical protein